MHPNEIARYHRQLRLQDWGEARQQLLKNARVLVVGAGGLGSPALLYLAAAGVGHLGIAEPDTVELSNLQRQILFATEDAGKPKLDAALRRLGELNPEIALIAHRARVCEENAGELIAAYDLVIDATDGFDARSSIHDACFRARKPYVYGAVDRFEGRVGVFFRHDGPCCRCLFPAGSSSAIQSCDQAGVLGVLPGVIGTLQATEAIKLIANIGEPLSGRILVYDALSADFNTFEIRKNPDCPLCGAGAEASPARATLSTRALREKLARGGSFRLIDVRERAEFAEGRIEGATNIPLGELDRRMGSLDRGEETILYCQRGPRSARALEVLRKTGFARVRWLEGGFQAYREWPGP